MDINPKVGLYRVKRDRGALNRLEREALAFYERVREGFLAMAKKEPERFFVIDGSQEPEPNLEKILARVLPLLQSKGLIPVRT